MFIKRPNDTVMKVCTKCHVEKRKDNFYHKDPIRLDSWCKKCKNKTQWNNRKSHKTTPEQRQAVREYAYKRYYGITFDQYNELLIQQNRKCLICRRDISEVPRQILCVDHNHQNKQIRGLLCINCNTGLGNFHDSAEMLQSAISYLGKI